MKAAVARGACFFRDPAASSARRDLRRTSPAAEGEGEPIVFVVFRYAFEGGPKL